MYIRKDRTYLFENGDVMNFRFHHWEDKKFYSITITLCCEDERSNYEELFDKDNDEIDKFIKDIVQNHENYCDTKAKRVRSKGD